jgi:hypothetical protein
MCRWLAYSGASILLNEVLYGGTVHPGRASPSVAPDPRPGIYQDRRVMHEPLPRRSQAPSNPIKAARAASPWVFPSSSIPPGPERGSDEMKRLSRSAILASVSSNPTMHPTSARMRPSRIRQSGGNGAPSSSPNNAGFRHGTRFALEQAAPARQQLVHAGCTDDRLLGHG